MRSLVIGLLLGLALGALTEAARAWTIAAAVGLDAPRPGVLVAR